MIGRSAGGCSRNQSEEADMYIGVGAVVLILVILLLIGVLR